MVRFTIKSLIKLGLIDWKDVMQLARNTYIEMNQKQGDEQRRKKQLEEIHRRNKEGRRQGHPRHGE